MNELLSLKMEFEFSNCLFKNKVYFKSKNYEINKILQQFKGKIDLIHSIKDAQIEIYHKYNNFRIKYFSYAYINYFESGFSKESFSYIKVGVIYNSKAIFKNFAINIDLLNNINSYFLTIDNHILNGVYNTDIKSGKYNFAFSADASSYFIHEVFGHFFEYDNFYAGHNKSIKLQNRIFDENFNLYDDPFFINNLEFGKTDATGKKYKKKCLVKNGVVVDTINNFRKQSSYNKPIYRMTNLVFESDDINTKSYNHYIYVESIYYGYIEYSTNKFFLFVSVAQKVSNGDVFNIKNNFVISGSIEEIVNNIELFNIKTSVNIGECIKENQIVLVGMSSPSLYVKGLNIL